MCVCHRQALTNALGYNAAAVGWVNHPVVVLDCMQSLNDGAHTANVTVDLCVIDELVRQIRVQPTLHLHQCNDINVMHRIRTCIAINYKFSPSTSYFTSI